MKSNEDAHLSTDTNTKISNATELFNAFLDVTAIGVAGLYIYFFAWHVASYANSMNISYLESAKAIMGLSN